MYDILNTIYYEFDFEMGITNIINSKISMCVKVQMILVSGTLIMIDSVCKYGCVYCLLSLPQPRKALMDQLGVVLGGLEESLPDTVMLVNIAEWQGQVNISSAQVCVY